MLFYVFLGVIAALFAFTAAQVQRSQFIIAAPLIILIAYFIGFRDLSIGTDTLRYAEIYHDIKPLFTALAQESFGFEAQRIEIGFVTLASLFRELGISFSGFLFVLNLFTLAIIYRSFSLLDGRLGPILFFLYTCTFTFITLQYNIVRQGIAVAICTYAFIKMLNGKHIQFLMFTLLATTFHSMSVLFLCVWPFRNFKWRPLYILVFTFIFVVIANVDFLSELANLLAPYSLSMYRVANYMITQAGSTNFLSIAILFDFLLICYCIIDSRFLRQYSKRFDVILTTFVIGFLGMAALHELNLLSLRFFYLFCPYEVYLFALSFSRFKAELWLRTTMLLSFGMLWLVKNLFITAQFITTY
ncbi:EpsG family protein [Shewanella waksmanii]|uniref:EpsG family protein n=1 Tax=Shewanella waksmanii TaxID=213783 RepID=UPI003736AE57